MFQKDWTPHLRDHSYTKLERKGLDQENIRPGEEKENHPLLPPHLRDHCYSKLERTGQLIPLQYADDICWLGINCSHEVERIKTEIPSILERRNLMINMYEPHFISSLRYFVPNTAAQILLPHFLKHCPRNFFFFSRFLLLETGQLKTRIL